MSLSHRSNLRSFRFIHHWRGIYRSTLLFGFIYNFSGVRLRNGHALVLAGEVIRRPVRAILHSGHARLVVVASIHCLAI